MGAFLWTVAIFAGINTLAVIWLAMTDKLPNVTPWSRAADAVLTACAGLWAFWLLATNGGC